MRIRPGQVAVVTGAARGIGYALTSRLVTDGVKVVMVDVDGAELAESASRLSGEVLPVVADVTVLADVERARSETLGRFGIPDLLVNNAGVLGGRAPVWEIPAEEWRRTLGINVSGAFHVLRTFLPDMVAAGTGHVVNMSSVLGLSAAGHVAGYVSSKHAIVGLTESLRFELAEHAPGIGVTLVCPGAVRTRLIAGIEEVADIAIPASEMADQIVAAVLRDEPRVVGAFGPVQTARD